MMTENAGNMSFLEEQWLQDLVEKVGHQLHARKKKDILLYEIEKGADEIEHIKGRIAIARGELKSKEEAVERLQHHLADAREKSRHLKSERERAEEDLSRLKRAGKDMKKKLAALPLMREEIKRLKGEVRRSTRRLKALRSDHRDTLEKKERIEADCQTSRAGLDRFEQEISVMKDTFTLMTGQRPEDFDPETFDSLQEDVEKRVDEFTNEMMEEIEKVKESTLSLKAKLEENKDGENALLSKKEELLRAVEGLKAQAGEDRSPEDLEAELDEMKRRQGRFAVSIEERKGEIRRLESATESVMTRIGEEEEFGGRLNERLSLLKMRKEEMDRLGNVAEEIERLADETRGLERASKINTSLHETVKELIAGLVPMNRELGSAIEEYKVRFSEVEQEIEQLLGTRPGEEGEWSVNSGQ